MRKPTECNCSIFTGFYAYTKLNHIVGFLSICFQKQRQGSFEKNEKQKAMVLVIAKMNMKAHFINFFKYENFVKMLVFIKVNESSLVSQM